MYKSAAQKLAEIKADPRVSELSDERITGDGYWVYTKKGWMFPEMGCHTAHENTVNQLWRVYRTIAPCQCTECIK